MPRKSEPFRVVAKHRPDPGPEQFNLWGAFVASSEQDEPIEAAPKRSANLTDAVALARPEGDPGAAAQSRLNCVGSAMQKLLIRFSEPSRRDIQLRRIGPDIVHISADTELAARMRR